MKKNTGFTIIELLIVVAILGIIATIAIPMYTGYIASARMTEAQNNIAALKLAEEEYYLENNGYFYETSNDNALLKSASNNLWEATGGSNGQVNFTYIVSGSGNTYQIIATGIAGSPVAGKTESFTKN